jgi:hypothetical protein
MIEILMLIVAWCGPATSVNVRQYVNECRKTASACIIYGPKPMLNVNCLLKVDL